MKQNIKTLFLFLAIGTMIILLFIGCLLEGPETITTTPTTEAADTTPPDFAAAPSTDNVALLTFDITATLDENGNVYYVVLADGSTAPNSSQVKAGTDASNSAATDNGNAVDSGSGVTITTGTLSTETAYDVYVVAEDTAINLQATPTLVEVTTGQITIDGSITETYYTSHYTDTMGAGNGIYDWADNAPTIGAIKTGRDTQYLYIGVNARTADSTNKESFHIIIDVNNNSADGTTDSNESIFYQDYLTEIGVDYLVYIKPNGYTQTGYSRMEQYDTNGIGTMIRDGQMDTNGTGDITNGCMNAVRADNTDFSFELRIPLSEMPGFDTNSRLTVAAAPRENTSYVHDIAPNNGNGIANDDTGTAAQIKIPADDSINGM